MRPLLVIPALFGTEIHDEELGAIWGTFGCLYRGPRIGTLAGLRGRPGKVMSQIPILGGIRYDVFGTLLRVLESIGYKPGSTMHLHAYDWRLSAMTLGQSLATEIRRLAAASGSEIDLLGLSNGGLLMRAAYAVDSDLPVRRVVTSGAPLAGSLETLACLHAGFQFAPFGRTVSPQEFIACPGAVDSIPTPDVPSFFQHGRGGDQQPFDLYDVATWKALRLSVFRGRTPSDEEAWTRVMTERLRQTRAGWEKMRNAPAPRELVCVCGAGLPTQVRVVVRDRQALVPGEGKVSRLPADALADGDGGVSVASATGWTGADARVIKIPVGRHRDVVRTPAAFAAITDALKN
ncbi:MAG TPA: hypothetical protein VH374_19075 [Polyangia bacterium]|nr:hypothetical protein [Polyangia bacterium]